MYSEVPLKESIIRYAQYTSQYFFVMMKHGGFLLRVQGLIYTDAEMSFQQNFATFCNRIYHFIYTEMVTSWNVMILDIVSCQNDNFW